jgi:hypothetical protein
MYTSHFRRIDESREVDGADFPVDPLWSILNSEAFGGEHGVDVRAVSFFERR